MPIQENSLSVLQKSRLFSSFSIREISLLLQKGNAYEERFPPLREIPFQKNGAARIGFLLSGSAAVYARKNGKGALLNRLVPGSCFGVAQLYGAQQKVPTRIECLEETSVLFIGARDFDELLCETKFSKNLISFLADRIRFLNRKICAFTAPSAETRLAFFLWEKSGGKETVIQDSYTALARELSLGRASLYRALEALENEGLIRKDGKTILITDPKRLEKRSENL